jgi:hypothetical protein
MPQPLVACESCKCHVKVSEPVCPFCGAEAKGARRAAPGHGHVSRIALVAMSAAVAATSVAAVGCSDGGTATETADGAPETRPGDAYGVAPFDAGPDAGPVGFDAAYGGPPFDAGPVVVVVDAAALYGVPPFDSGNDAAPVDASDSAPPFTVGDAYGVPPLDGGNRDR